ncbi:tRNA (N(6)-L-threonylcarbamoyladenosine(37)-C(2))-methylthiotransferase MtaB [Lichenicoccus sp.]|uniref:tRNA (N(6)-L-threonylcarbamoyladenosine(37)-C(2))- methylthiotransferase MtaB n=1 Tax=Lichenicoccus sp. TaxID=2781899 RepID=UPI003D0DA498
MNAPEVLTFGCRLNQFESEVMAGHAADSGVDLVIVNTCAVTKEAERQARQAIGRVRRARPDTRIVVTGCAAQIDPQRWSALAGVSRVIGNNEKLRAESWTPLALDSGDAVSDIMQDRASAAPMVAGFTARARAFVAVQHGCDHRCSFCVIPFGRGPSRSMPAGAIVEQVRVLVRAGYREVVLTGVDLTSYGADLPGRPRLGQLARRLLACAPELARLRLSSLDPMEIDEELWALLADEPRLMPHLHLSLQAGSDLILKRMKRRHLAADASSVIARARRARPGVAIGADLIAGFPTESDALFEETRAFVRTHALPYLHVFPYSARAGTPAARMPQVPMAVRRARARTLRREGEAAAASFHAAMLGETISVLLEGASMGHSAHFSPVRGELGERGEIVRARVTQSDHAGLLAERV